MLKVSTAEDFLALIAFVLADSQCSSKAISVAPKHQNNISMLVMVNIMDVREQVSVIRGLVTVNE